MMNTKGLKCVVVAAVLLSPVAMGRVRTEGLQHSNGGQHKGRASSPLVRAVRDATARFRDVNQAIAEGYAQFQGCVSGPQEGVMGVHYSNFGLFDDKLEVEHPEALVYEPQPNGRLELVAAEYITPADAWDATHTDFERPELRGQLFHFAPGPNRYGPPAFYELHVWAWRDNPKGVFTDWNPEASCAALDGPPFLN